MPEVAKAYEKKMVIEMGLQGNNPSSCSGAQTNWKRKVNKGVDPTYHLPIV
jgi:hypothetical protein